MAEPQHDTVPYRQVTDPPSDDGRARLQAALEYAEAHGHDHDARAYRRMLLPEGKTCGECLHHRRCAGMFGRDGKGHLGTCQFGDATRWVFAAEASTPATPSRQLEVEGLG